MMHPPRSVLTIIITICMCDVLVSHLSEFLGNQQVTTDSFGRRAKNSRTDRGVCYEFIKKGRGVSGVSGGVSNNIATTNQKRKYFSLED